MPDVDTAHLQPLAASVILDAAPGVTMVLDRTGTITWASAAVETLIEVPRDEMAGRNLTEFVIEEDVAILRQSLDHVLGTTGDLRPMEFRFRRPNGSVGVLEAVTANRLDDPLIRGIVVQVNEITRRTIVDDVLELIAGGGSFEKTLHLLAQFLEVQLGQCRVIIGVEPHGNRFTTAASVHDLVDEMTPPDPALDTTRPSALTGEQADVVELVPRDEPTLELLRPARGGADGPDPPWANSVRTGRPVIHADLSTLKDAARWDARAHGFAACWVFPVTSMGSADVNACLIVWRSKAGRPSPTDDISVARTGRLLSLALERRRTENLLLHAARHDPLTGLANRAQFFRHLSREMHRKGPLLAVLYLDLDGFKPINDRYGHRAGDHVLALVGERIEAVLRPSDLTARLGGDEFGVLCRELGSEKEAACIAERLITAIEQPLILPLDTMRSPEEAADAESPSTVANQRFQPVAVAVSVSIGIAFAHQSGHNDQRLVELADSAMYQAKASGRGTWFRSTERST